MAYHRKHHRKHHRKNPLGLSSGIVKEAAFVAAGAVGAAALPGMIAPSFSTGWGGVAASAAAAVAMGFVGKMIGDTGSDALKGGLAITVLKALKQAGINTPGLGLYAPSWFGIPTASSQYLVASPGNVPVNRGAGTLVATPSGPVLVPAAAGAAGAAGAGGHVSGRLGYHRFRSRYAGSYG
jgi:hypothetical protein